jgi:hypothetical protein
MLKQVFVAAALLFAPIGAGAHAQTISSPQLSQLFSWTDGLIEANRPAEAAQQSMRQIVRAIQSGSTPEERGAALVAIGPQLSAALAQARQGRAAVEGYQRFASGDVDLDGLAAATHQTLRTNGESVERMLVGIEQMHLAAVRRDSAGVQQAARALLPFPAAMLRGTAASFRLLALRSRGDLSTYHFLRARAAFAEAGAVAADLPGVLDMESFESHITDATTAIAIGRVSLQADQQMLLTPGLDEAQRAIIADLLQVQDRSYDLLERAVTSADEAIARAGPSATPEQRLAALREAGAIERELAPLSARASALATQFVR